MQLAGHFSLPTKEKESTNSLAWSSHSCMHTIQLDGYQCYKLAGISPMITLMLTVRREESMKRVHVFSTFAGKIFETCAHKLSICVSKLQKACMQIIVYII